MTPGHLKTILFAAALSVGVSIGNAATLTPGGSTAVSWTDVGAEPELAGAVVNDNTLDIPVTHLPNPDSPWFVDFDIHNRVTKSAADGTMIFGPRILWTHNVTGDFFLVDSISLFGFGDFATDVAYRTDGPGDRGPTFAERSADGETLTFEFEFLIAVSNLFEGIHETSYSLSINTDATAFKNTGRASIFGRSLESPDQIVQFDYSGLAVPVPAPVPLPASIVFLLGSFGVLLGLRRPWRPVQRPTPKHISSPETCLI